MELRRARQETPIADTPLNGSRVNERENTTLVAGEPSPTPLCGRGIALPLSPPAGPPSSRALSLSPPIFSHFSLLYPLSPSPLPSPTFLPFYPFPCPPASEGKGSPHSHSALQNKTSIIAIISSAVCKSSHPGRHSGACEVKDADGGAGGGGEGARGISSRDMAECNLISSFAFPLMPFDVLLARLWWRGRKGRRAGRAGRAGEGGGASRRREEEGGWKLCNEVVGFVLGCNLQPLLTILA